jgi:hypothetical protein
MTNTVDQDVIESLKQFKPENYMHTLWCMKIIHTQGAFTLDQLVKSFVITEEGKQFAEKHFENPESEVMEAFQDFYYEVCQSEALNIIKQAEDGDEFWSYLLEYKKDERLNAAMEELEDDMNYPALSSFMAYMYDNVTMI